MGFRYVLVVMNYVTCFPEAITLKNTTARTIVVEFLKIFTQVGLPRELLTDQGANFTSLGAPTPHVRVGIKKLQTSVYQPQTDGLMVQFNRTLKGMLRKFPPVELHHWDLLPLLFTIRRSHRPPPNVHPSNCCMGANLKRCWSWCERYGSRPHPNAGASAIHGAVAGMAGPGSDHCKREPPDCPRYPGPSLQPGHLHSDLRAGRASARLAPLRRVQTPSMLVESI